MNAKLLLALGLPLPLTGCMMAGMAGMAGMVGMGGMGHATPRGTHDANPTTAAEGPLIVKEVVANGIRLTAEFPSFGPRDSLAYTVTLRDLSGRAITSDALVVLSALPASGAGAHSRDPWQLWLEPALRGGGSFIFRPSIPRGGSYRLTILLERVGDAVLDPPLAVEQAVQLSAPLGHDAGAGHAQDRAGLTPLLLLGAGLMAVMMIFTFR